MSDGLLTRARFLRERVHSVASIDDGRRELTVIVRCEMAADGAVLALTREQPRGWIIHGTDFSRPMTSAQASKATSITFLSQVRSANRRVYEPVLIPGLTSKSLAENQIVQALGAPLRDLNAPMHAPSFGVLYVDRRRPREAFTIEEQERICDLAGFVSLGLKELEDRFTAGTRVDPHRAAVRKIIEQCAGNLSRAAGCLRQQDNLRALGERDALRHYVESNGWVPWVRSLRAVKPQVRIKRLIEELGDLRKVSAALGGRNYESLNRLLTRERGGSLRGLVSELGLSWESVHGPEFQASSHKGSSAKS